MRCEHFVVIGVVAVLTVGPLSAQTGTIKRGALVRVQEASPSIVRVLAVPGDRVAVYRSSLYVSTPGSAVGVRVEGLSASLLGSAQYGAHINEPMRKPLLLASDQYFVVGDSPGNYFVDVINSSRITSELHDDGRVPYLPHPIH